MPGHERFGAPRTASRVRTCEHPGVRRERVAASFDRGTGVVALVLAVLVAAACGSTTSTKAGAKPGNHIYTYLRDIVTRAAVGDPDLAPVVSAACRAYADDLRTRGGDSATFDEYVADLFDTGAGGLDQGRVDRAVTDACASFDGDVPGFVGDLSASLGIGLGELRGYIATACAGFEQRRRANAADPNAPEPFDPLVSDVFAKGRLDRTDLTALVDAACSEFPETASPAPGVGKPTTPRTYQEELRN